MRSVCLLALILVALVMHGCDCQAKVKTSVVEVPIDLSAFTSHLSNGQEVSDEKSRAMGTSSVIYDVDVSFEEAVAKLAPLLTGAGWEDKGGRAKPSKGGTRFRFFNLGKERTVFVWDEPNKLLRLPSRGRVTLNYITSKGDQAHRPDTKP